MSGRSLQGYVVVWGFALWGRLLLACTRDRLTDADVLWLCLGSNVAAWQDYTRVRGVNAAQRHNRAINPPLEGHGPDDDRIVDAAIDAGTGLVLNLGRTTQVSRISRAALELTSGADAATGGVGAAGRSGKGAFASVNVAADMVQQYEAGMAPEGWYRRRENNGWRPVSLKTLEEADKDPVTVATNRLAKSFHFSKVKRREDALRQRKLKKRKWLMKMYREGLAKERGGGGGKEGEAEEAAATNHGKTGGSLEDVLDLEDDEWEDNAEHLLKWSTALDFDRCVLVWVRAVQCACNDMVAVCVRAQLRCGLAGCWHVRPATGSAIGRCGLGARPWKPHVLGRVVRSRRRHRRDDCHPPRHRLRRNVLALGLICTVSVWVCTSLCVATEHHSYTP